MGLYIAPSGLDLLPLLIQGLRASRLPLATLLRTFGALGRNLTLWPPKPILRHLRLRADGRQWAHVRAFGEI